MKLLSSLRGRIFLATALLAVMAIGVAIYIVSRRVTDEAENGLRREVIASGAVVDQLRTTRTQTLTVMARLIADLPKLKGAVDTNDPPTVQDIAADYQSQLKSNLFLVTNAAGQVLATVGASSSAARLVAEQPAVHDALAGRESIALLAQPEGILQVVTVPITIGQTQPQMLGTLSVGFLLDDALAAQLKETTLSDIAFGMDSRILAATLPQEFYPVLAQQLHTHGIGDVTLGTDEYMLFPRPLTTAQPDKTGPVALILRSRTDQRRSLSGIHTALAVTGFLSVLLAILLSFAVARTITRPLAAITDVMREVAATGDLTRKIVLRQGWRWNDEDATLLASTFNSLTDSVARFQREMSQRERLSSLGRLSTVIAHEIRNPLMIIKASLHALKQPGIDQSAIHEAVRDIDGEVGRLNRIVNEVLDFARPIRFEFAPTDINALCRESSAAAQAGMPGAPVQLDLDPAATTVTTDPERLRIAVVNMLVNARHAVNGNGGSVSLKTRMNGDRTAIVISDTGVGIDSEDLPRVFDPYFTTKRGGTGLGLAISKNIIEGLGGTIGVTSTLGQGTDIRIELPLHAAHG